jgi:hypothetical protein
MSFWQVAVCGFGLAVCGAMKDYFNTDRDYCMLVLKYLVIL